MVHILYQILGLSGNVGNRHQVQIVGLASEKPHQARLPAKLSMATGGHWQHPNLARRAESHAKSFRGLLESFWMSCISSETGDVPSHYSQYISKGYRYDIRFTSLGKT